MPILVVCQCGKQCWVGDEFAGKVGKCPACGNAVHVLDPAHARDAKPAPPATTPTSSSEKECQTPAPEPRSSPEAIANKVCQDYAKEIAESRQPWVAILLEPLTRRIRRALPAVGIAALVAVVALVSMPYLTRRAASPTNSKRVVSSPTPVERTEPALTPTPAPFPTPMAAPILAPTPRPVLTPTPSPRPLEPECSTSWETDFGCFVQEFDNAVRLGEVAVAVFDKSCAGRTVKWKLIFQGITTTKEGKKDINFNLEPYGILKKVFESPRWVWVGFEPAPGALPKWEKIKPGTAVSLEGKYDHSSRMEFVHPIRRKWGMATIVDLTVAESQ